MSTQNSGPDDLETWENVSRSRFVLKKFSQTGALTGQMIKGGAKFHVSTKERQINQEIAATKKLDPFLNGTFSPVRLLETTEDAEEIASNPNTIGEEEIVKLVKGPVAALRSRLAEMENLITIERVLEVAKGADVTVSKLEAIEARITEVRPDTHVEINNSGF